jgi:hypothetical protein
MEEVPLPKRQARCAHAASYFWNTGLFQYGHANFTTDSGANEHISNYIVSHQAHIVERRTSGRAEESAVPHKQQDKPSLPNVGPDN